MPRQIKLESHLSVAELEQHYRQAVAPITRNHFQILWLLAQGKAAQAVSEVTGYSRYWVGQIARRYNEGGVEAMGDQRHHNRGGQWLLSEAQKQELDQVLQQPPEDGGLWTGPKVAAWIEKTLEKPVHPQRGWDYLHLLDFTPQVPRPRHHKADAEAQEVFKKNTA